MNLIKRIFLSVVSLLLVLGLSVFEHKTFALNNSSFNKSKENEIIIEPKANKKVIFNFDDIYVSVEHQKVDLQLYGYIDDVSGKLINVAGIQWYNNADIGYYNLDDMKIVETTRIDNYTIKVRMKYIYKNIFGTVLSEHYFNVWCDSPGPMVRLLKN